MADFVPGFCGPSASEQRMKAPKNSTTCVYSTKLWGACRLITLTWHKTLMSQTLNLDVAGFVTCHVDLKPWFSWKKKQGRKTLNAGGHELEVFWNLNGAKFDCGPEPRENFYVSLVSGGEMVLLVGDLEAEAYERTGAENPFIDPVLISRRANIFGKKYYRASARFGDKCHDIVIKCETGGGKEARLYLCVDEVVVLKVKHLAWKFRGNRTIFIDGEAVEFFWDVHNWLFQSVMGYAVFMFQTYLSNEGKQRFCVGIEGEKKVRSLEEEESIANPNPGGFSLLLYAWNNN